MAARSNAFVLMMSESEVAQSGEKDGERQPLVRQRCQKGEMTIEINWCFFVLKMASHFLLWCTKIFFPCLSLVVPLPSSCAPLMFRMFLLFSYSTERK